MGDYFFLTANLYFIKNKNAAWLLMQHDNP